MSSDPTVMDAAVALLVEALPCHARAAGDIGPVMNCGYSHAAEGLSYMSRRLVLTRALLGMLAGIAIGALISEATYFFLRSGDERTPRVIELDIPLGTAIRVEAGEPEPSLPTSMTFVVGDVLTVRNKDSVSHELGPLFIPAGASASLKLESAQAYAADCSFQPTGSFGIEVQPALTLQTRIVGILQAGIPLGFLFILYGVFAIPSARAKGT